MNDKYKVTDNSPSKYLLSQKSFVDNITNVLDKKTTFSIKKDTFSRFFSLYSMANNSSVKSSSREDLLIRNTINSQYNKLKNQFDDRLEDVFSLKEFYFSSPSKNTFVAYSKIDSLTTFANILGIDYFEDKSRALVKKSLDDLIPKRKTFDYDLVFKNDSFVVNYVEDGSLTSSSPFVFEKKINSLAKKKKKEKSSFFVLPKKFLSTGIIAGSIIFSAYLVSTNLNKNNSSPDYVSSNYVLGKKDSLLTFSKQKDSLFLNNYFSPVSQENSFSGKKQFKSNSKKKTLEKNRSKKIISKKNMQQSTTHNYSNNVQENISGIASENILGNTLGNILGDDSIASLEDRISNLKISKKKEVEKTDSSDDEIITMNSAELVYRDLHQENTYESKKSIYGGKK